MNIDTKKMWDKLKKANAAEQEIRRQYIERIKNEIDKIEKSLNLIIQSRQNYKK